MKVFEPFMSDGAVSFKSDMSCATNIKVLRYTGSYQSLLLADKPCFKQTTDPIAQAHPALYAACALTKFPVAPKTFKQT